MKANPAFKLKTDFNKDIEKLFGKKTKPGLVKGDFNGDGIEDTVALLIKNKKHAMVFFISNGGSFKMLSKEIPDTDSMYLTTVSKNKIKSGLPKNQSRDLVQLEVFMGPTEAYFVEKNKVIEFRGTFN